jgi:hypothetical protein
VRIGFTIEVEDGNEYLDTESKGGLTYPAFERLAESVEWLGRVQTVMPLADGETFELKSVEHARSERPIEA